MDIYYLIKLWENSNFDSIMIKSLPLARCSDKVVVQPTLILSKNQKITFGGELTSFDYLKLLFPDSFFEYVEDSDYLIFKEISRRIFL